MALLLQQDGAYRLAFALGYADVPTVVFPTTAATLERLVQGGRSTIIPISVSGDVVGALIVGPMAEDPGFSTVVQVRDLVHETASRLTEAWRTRP